MRWCNPVILILLASNLYFNIFWSHCFNSPESKAQVRYDNIYVVPVVYLPYFFNPTLNIKMVFGEKMPKMGTISDFVTFFFVKCYNKI